MSENRPAASSGFMTSVVYFMTFLLLCIGKQVAFNAYSTDFATTSDESAHFVSSLLIFDYFRDGLPAQPLKYATDYYNHFPRVAIGHWPPGMYALQAVVFALAGRTAIAALGVQACCVALACATAATVVNRRAGLLIGWVAGLAVLAAPLVLVQLNEFMLDIALGVLVLGVAITWANFVRTRLFSHALQFAVWSIAAIMTKGNGLFIALLPLIHVAISRDLGPLRTWQIWVAALVVGTVILPWQVFTYQMVAKGFVYEWGWSYTSLAVPFFLKKSLSAIGVIGILGFVAGAGRAIRAPNGERGQTLTALTALVFSALLFQCLAPADITERYLIPIIPAAFIVSAIGLNAAFRRIPFRSAAFVPICVAILMSVNATLLFVPPSRVEPVGMMPIAQHILEFGNDNPLILVSGDERAEGALIASVALLNSTRTHYVLRAGQQLSKSNFMGTRYEGRFETAEEVAIWLHDSGIGWVVINNSPNAKKIPHNDLLIEAVTNQGAEEWERVMDQNGHGGIVSLYKLSTASPSTSQIEKLLERVKPSS